MSTLFFREVRLLHAHIAISIVLGKFTAIEELWPVKAKLLQYWEAATLDVEAQRPTRSNWCVPSGGAHGCEDTAEKEFEIGAATILDEWSEGLQLQPRVLLRFLSRKIRHDSIIIGHVFTERYINRFTF